MFIFSRETAAEVSEKNAQIDSLKKKLKSSQQKSRRLKAGTHEATNRYNTLLQHHTTVIVFLNLSNSSNISDRKV